MKLWFREFIQGVLSTNASYSFGRFMSLVITMFVLGWDTSYVVIAYQWNHHLAAGVAPVDFLPGAVTLASQAAFMTIFYSVTKYGDMKTGQSPQQSNSQ